MRKRFGGVVFESLEAINPERNNGKVKTYTPQVRYRNARGLRRHQYGRGRFCRFRIRFKAGLSGVYIVTVEKEVKYVGECQDLFSRFNSGYGNISPRNCFVGGQLTNCRINKAILFTVLSGGSAYLWFHRAKKDERKMTEKKLISLLNPEWNQKGNVDVAKGSHNK